MKLQEKKVTQLHGLGGWEVGGGCWAEGTTRSMCLLQIGLLCHILQCAAVIMAVPPMLRTLMFTLDMQLSKSSVSSDSVCWRGCRWLLASCYLQDVLSYRSSVSGMTDNCNQCELSTIPSQSKADDGFRSFVWWRPLVFSGHAVETIRQRHALTTHTCVCLR